MWNTYYVETKTRRTIVIIFLLGLVFSSIVYSTSSTHNSMMRLQLINSFTASTTLHTTGYVSGGIVYISHPDIMVDMHASTGSTFILSGGDLSTSYIGSGVGNYTISYPILLQGGDGIKAIPSVYYKDTEFLFVDDVSVFLDQSAPTVPTIYTPVMGSTHYTGTITLDRGVSVDTGVGVKEYTVVVDRTPMFFDSYIQTTSDSLLSLHQDDLPPGRLYWYVEVTDYLGHTSHSDVMSFANRYGIKIHHGGHGGGSGIIRIIKTPHTEVVENTQIMDGDHESPSESIHKQDIRTIEEKKRSRSGFVFPEELMRTGADRY